jgi:hypothetical protein
MSDEGSERVEEQNGGEEELDLPEAAPTDYRRNAWLLAFMIAVVVLAGLVRWFRHML